MDAGEPHVRVVRRQCAPETYPCPHCGKRGRRKQTHTRLVRCIAYREIVVVEIEVGEYRARCACGKTFRSQVPGIEARAAYTNRVRDAVLDRLLDDGMSMERLHQALRRDFHLDLSTGFLYDCLDWKCRPLDLPDYRRWTLAHFSGTLCLDEIHLGQRTLLLATDALSDFPVAFALVSANDQEHMRRFLHNLRNWGFAPQVVVSDGSNLYPRLLAEVWPQAQHQLCLFHLLRDVNACVLGALRRLRRQLARQGRANRRRGRPSKAQQRAGGPLRGDQARTGLFHLEASLPAHPPARNLDRPRPPRPQSDVCRLAGAAPAVRLRAGRLRDLPARAECAAGDGPLGQAGDRRGVLGRPRPGPRPGHAGPGEVREAGSSRS
jgi:hypothetical protein